MKIAFSEPANPRYLYVNPETNKVHLLLPIVGGVDIGTDNTCKTVYAMKEFFGDEGAMKSLQSYKTALENDITLLADGDKVKKEKQERLDQINKHIEILANVQENNPQIADMREIYYPQYPDAIKSLLAASENFSYILLCPGKPDREIRGSNHIFSVNREYDPATQKNTGTLATTLESAFKDFKPASKSPKEKLISAVSASHQGKIDFDTLLEEISAKAKELFGDEMTLVFNEPGTNQKLTRSYLEDVLMVIESDSSVKDIVENVLNACAGDLDISVQASPFDQVTSSDKLSILTQFYLAQTNIFCHSNKLSTANFGEVLEKDPKLSAELATTVKSAIESGNSVESALFNFVNEHAKDFGLQNPLSKEQKQVIEGKFSSQLAVIKDSPHFDEFCMLDDTKPGKIMTHQGAICADFADVIAHMPGMQYDEKFIGEIAADYKSGVARSVSQTNDFVKGLTELDDNKIGITINNLLNHGKIELVAVMLMSNTDNGKKLFERLDGETFNLLSQHKNFGQLKSQFAELKVDQKAIQAFNERISSTKPAVTAPPPQPTTPKIPTTSGTQSSIPDAPKPPPVPTSTKKLFAGLAKQAPASSADPEISLLKSLSSMSSSSGITPISSSAVLRANVGGILPASPRADVSHEKESTLASEPQTITVKNK